MANENVATFNMAIDAIVAGTDVNANVDAAVRAYTDMHAATRGTVFASAMSRVIVANPTIAGTLAERMANVATATVSRTRGTDPAVVMQNVVDRYATLRAVASMAEYMATSIAIEWDDDDPSAFDTIVRNATPTIDTATVFGRSVGRTGTVNGRVVPRRTYKSTVADMVSGGIVANGTKIAGPTPGTKSGVIVPTGIRVAGKIYANPTSAAAAAGVTGQINGWAWWRMPNGDTLASVRPTS